MHIKSLTLAAALALAASTAQAVTYTYSGNPTFGTGSFVAATADLDCAGPCAAGEYVYSSGISEFSLSIYSNTGSLLQSLSSDTPGVSLGSYGNSYLMLNASGNVTSWFLYLDGNGSQSPQIYTMRDALGPPSFTMDYGFSSDRDTTYVNLADTPGTWQVAAVPEPSTWVMLIFGFAGLGFMACRRRSVGALADCAAVR
jgi:hypothetical protein